MRIKSFIALLALPMLAAAFFASAQNASPIGRWKTLDDETGKPMTITEIYEAKNGTYAAKIVENLGLPATCADCSDEYKGKPTIGIVTMWNLKAIAGGWGGGQGYKPSKDRKFKVKMVKLSPDGNTLTITGCVMMICRDAEWKRVK